MRSTMSTVMGGRAGIAAWVLLGGAAGALAPEVMQQRLPFSQSRRGPRNKVASSTWNGLFLPLALSRVRQAVSLPGLW